MIAAFVLAAVCNPSLWAHTYRHERFTIIATCKEFVGVVESKKAEADGDIHIRLRLDAGQGHPLNGRNVAAQKSCLVVEPVCVGKVKQADAKDPCRGAPVVKVPSIGAHVKARGVYVVDHEAGHGWIEIHAAEFDPVK